MTPLVFSLFLLGLSSALGKVCLPPQFQTKLSLFGGVAAGGQASLQTGIIGMVTDMSKKKAFYDINLTTGLTQSALKALEDHSVAPAVRYEYTQHNCNKTAPQFDFEPYCLPDNAVVVGNVVLGDPQTQNNVTVYSFSSGALSNGYIAMSDRNIPVIQDQTITYPGVSIVQSLAYYDAKTTIDDPSVFDVPAHCHHAAAVGRK